jgi:chromosome segregation ATPase
MRRFALSTSIFTTLVIVSSVALAQPTRRPGTPPNPTPAPAPAPTATAVPPARNICPGRRAVIANEQNRLDDQRAALAGVGAEIDALKRRLDELERQRLDLIKTVARSEVRYEDKLATYRGECEQSESCDQYEKMAGDLDTGNSPVQTALAQVKTDIQGSMKEVALLRTRIEPLRKEYDQLRCTNLVPGETAQTTIDRCSSIFSEWNRLQADLNQQNNRLPVMRSRYEQLTAQLRSTEARAKDYEEYLARNCKSSQKLTVVRGYRGVTDRARALERELDQLVQEVTNLRGIRITVSPD